MQVDAAARLCGSMSHGQELTDDDIGAERGLSICVVLSRTVCDTPASMQISSLNPEKSPAAYF